MSDPSKADDDALAKRAEQARYPAEMRPPGEEYEINIVFADLDEYERAYEAIEKLLHDMGQIGTLSGGPRSPGCT